MKLAVGSRDLADLRDWQQQRAHEAPPLRHLTRQMPRRAPEIVAGGSLFWVIQGAMLVRQRILAIRADSMADGSACAGLVLDAALVAVQARPVRAFQGWRYLAADAAPPDTSDRGAGEDDAALPEALRRALRELRLI